jgi:hypothetical protein
LFNTVKWIFVIKNVNFFSVEIAGVFLDVACFNLLQDLFFIGEQNETLRKKLSIDLAF